MYVYPALLNRDWKILLNPSLTYIFLQQARITVVIPKAHVLHWYMEGHASEYDFVEIPALTTKMIINALLYDLITEGSDLCT